MDSPAIRTLLIFGLILGNFLKFCCNGDEISATAAYGSAPSGLTEHPGGIITEGQQRLFKTRSPYWLRSDIVVEKNAELVIEPGVEIRFEPMIGITVRGILTAVGTLSEQITLTSSQDNPVPAHQQEIPDIRLVDGPSVLAGRVQLKHLGKWRSVCTNSRNWTRSDIETACRHLGFQGGNFYNWYDRQMPLKPRLLYEQPKCNGTERSVFDCYWDSRQLGSGVCDYHPDLGIECLPRHDTPLPFWRGIRFENALRTKILTPDNTLYVPTSRSKLAHVSVKYAGSGRDHNAISAVHIQGVPPVMENLQVIYSAYNGINITSPEAPIIINDCSIKNNRGYGIFINSSYGLAQIEGCNIVENGADGIKYVHQEDRPDERPDRGDFSEFCTLAITHSQIYPIQIFAEQSKFSTSARGCSKSFFAHSGHVLTLSFVRSETDRNNSAQIQVFDGSTMNDNRLTSFHIRNNTRPQSVTTTSNRIHIVFKAEQKTQMLTYMKLTSGLKKTYDIMVKSAYIADNNGRGLAFDNLRSQLRVHNSTISNNNHVAGIHITSGVGDVNITDSRISFNDGDGVNITYSGGNRNISKSMISSNKGYGIAIWLNDTEESEYIHHNQTTVVQYSEIVKNLDTGILHGNYCGESYVNITGNTFLNGVRTSLEIMSCWKPSRTLAKLQIGHNVFASNEDLGIKIVPALNLDGRIEFNNFRKGLFGAILIKNQPLEEFIILRTNIVIQQNNFFDNTGIFVVNLGLSPYSEIQRLLFYRNFVKNNVIKEPFQMEDGAISRLTPRTRVAAPVVVSSNNVDIFRNILDNPHSKYEIGSHFEDQSKVVNCTYNWLGFSEEHKIFDRIFHRNDRYNLAKIKFIPYLLHSSFPLTNTIVQLQLYIPKFVNDQSNIVGGEIEGQETLPAGEYIVDRDINIRPSGILILEPGVTLKFPPSIGMMIGGKIEARGNGPNNIKFTLKEEIVQPENDTYEIITERLDSETEILEIEPKVPIRLLGGKTAREGRLQIKINNEWGTVCNYEWTILDAALVCHQLGLVLNPDDWYMERSEIPDAGTTENILLTNVRCDELDTDITKCKSDRAGQFENSCTHDHDVGVRCHESSWAGIRFGVLAERSDLQFITIEKAGLLDYSTNQFKPALQIDFARHNLESIRIVENYHDGIGVIYSDIYSADAENILRNSELLRNKGSGISFKQLGMRIQGTSIENNAEAGIRHNPALSGLQQRELAGWFNTVEHDTIYKPIFIPNSNKDIHLDQGETKYMVTQRVQIDSISKRYVIKCPPGYVIGLQLLNPIHNRSTESILIHDSQSVNNKSSRWYLTRDLSVFPTTSSSYGILLFYDSGINALGGTVLAITAVRAPVQDIRNRIVKGPVPTLTITNSNIKGNKFGIHASYYNRYLDELGDHYLRKANESFKIFNCEISHNLQEAIFINSPYWDIHESNISEITVMINNTLVTDNGKGIYHFSRDMRGSNNLFHYVLQDNTIERNKANGFEINLPYVWQYDENFTHSVYFNNNTWRSNQDFGISIDGHFANVNITKNIFRSNRCKQGLLAIKGMEKKMKIDNNKIEDNIGKYMVEFNSDSQSEIMGEIYAVFIYNEIRNNKFAVLQFRNFGSLQLPQKEPTALVRFNGIQKVRINQNLFSNNNQDYQLIAGIRTARINNYLDARFNWWDTKDEKQIQEQIFDFDDWNNHAVATYKPFLTEDLFDASYSDSSEKENEIDLENLGGRITKDVILHRRETPYIINSDITIMPKVKVTINPGVEMAFAANIGILVLGTLKAKGLRGAEIKMRPISKFGNLEDKKVVRRSINENTRSKRDLENLMSHEVIRLCKGRDCSGEEIPNEGFLEYFNKTTLQWVPMCDPRFTERNAQVVCRQLGFDPINVYFDYDIRVEYHSNSLSRIWSWPEPLQCSGAETNYEDCPIRLNGQLYGHRHECKWNSKFVFIHCGKRNLRKRMDYWGGIRFTGSEFEQHLYEHRIHDVVTHTTIQKEDSELEFVNIIGAGILHNEKSPSLQSIVKSPKIKFVNITKSASHAINIISPSNNVELLFNNIEDTLGAGINLLSLTGEGQEAEESSFSPLKDLNIPYNLFSVVDICDTSKVITIEERVLVYYKYDNHPVNCVKIFKSSYNVKPFGFRLLQFNLFNSTNKPGKPDSITLYDGDIYNVSSTILGKIEVGSRDEKKLFKTKEPSLSVKLFANGASSFHGFIAEIVTLPISAIVFNRDIQHNISHSVLSNNREGAVSYISAGEVNPILTLDKNQFRGNCEKLYGNFTTCPAAVHIDIQNTQTIYFRNNLMKENQGGLSIKADSRGSATSLKGWIHNNLFVNNTNLPALYVEGRQSSPYQEVTIYRNYFTQNYAEYQNTIVLKQVVSNFTLNYVKKNIGQNILEVSGFDKVRLPIYQSTSHNGFYKNYALNRDSRSTVVAGTAGQHYVDNIFFNPDNDYEMITVNRSLFNFTSSLDAWKTKIDGAYNYWGYNETLAVSGRIRDMSDDPNLLEVTYAPYYMNNETILNGKCPPGWDLVGDTCYIYVGAPMSFFEARDFCRSDNASMPYILGNYHGLYQFLRRQQQWYHYSERVWVQDIDRINQCTMFAYQTIEIDSCTQRSAFLCEIDPKIIIDPLSWRGDIVIMGAIGTAAIAVFLILLVVGCWYTKSKYRNAQRLERRNSIRQSLNSLKSVGTNGGFSELGYRRKAAQMSTRSTDTLTKSSDYKKMVSNGSIDSMEKSTFNSSIDDNQSFDIFEAHNPNPSGYSTYSAPMNGFHNPILKAQQEFAPKPVNEYMEPNTFGLAYKNEGFRDTSTFASTANSTFPSRAESVQEEVPIIHAQHEPQEDTYTASDYYNTDTLPLNSTLGQSDSTLDLKRELDENNRFYDSEKPQMNFLQELKQKMPQTSKEELQMTPTSYSDLPSPPDPPQTAKSHHQPSTNISQLYSPDYHTLGIGTVTSEQSQPPEPSYYFVQNGPGPTIPQNYNTLDAPSSSKPNDQIHYEEPNQDRPKSVNLLETDLTATGTPKRTPKMRAKSEALLETNFDYFEPEPEVSHQPLTESSRSKSQPLETAM